MKETGTYSITRARGRAGKVMLIPSLLILGIFVVYPIIRSLFLSLYDWNLLTGVSSFNGLGNFAKAAGDERFWNALKNILYFSSLYVPGTLLIALGLAWLLYRGIPGKNLFRSIFFLPAISAMSIVALCWRFLLDGDIGLFSYWGRMLGFLVSDSLRDPDRAMPVVILVSIWKVAGFNMVILLAGLHNIPDTYYEAAEIDGAGRGRQFLSITLPLLLPSISFVIITNVIGSFQVFDQVYVMTKGGPMFRTETLVTYIHYQGFTLFNMGYASSMALVLFFLIMLVTVFQIRLFRKGEMEGGMG
jgi:multiple sugar transport system permease protein